MKKVAFFENKHLEKRLMSKEKLTKAKISQFHKGIQNKMSGEEVTPKERAKDKNIS